jgi:GFO/IDH/MocA oxidoreductase family protein
MKKIGFIDYHIDEWHANNYPQWIRESTRKDDFEIAYAWEESQGEGLRSLEAWCKDFSVTPAKNIEQIVEDCDGLIVLAPSNPEVHERLADIPLQSGKPVYIDKPFAPDKATAEALFEKAEKHGTPLFSSSALRFGSEIQKAVKETLTRECVDFAFSAGGGTSFEEYSIHQIEMLVMLMGTGAERVMQCGSNRTNQLLIDYGSGRRSVMTLMPGHGFQISADCEKDRVTINSMTDFFPCLLEAILEFFETGCPPVKKEETIEIVSILETGIKALEKRDIWIDL